MGPKSPHFGGPAPPPKSILATGLILVHFDMRRVVCKLEKGRCKPLLAFPICVMHPVSWFIIYLFTWLNIYHLFIYFVNYVLFIYLFIYLFNLFIYSFNLFIYLCICLYVYFQSFLFSSPAVFNFSTFSLFSTCFNKVKINDKFLILQ